jgi:hypothetical protein
MNWVVLPTHQSIPARNTACSILAHLSNEEQVLLPHERSNTMHKFQKKAHQVRNAVLYTDIQRRLRAASRCTPEYAEARARLLGAMLRVQPGYAKAVAGKNRERVRWCLVTIPRLPHELVLELLPPGCIGAAKLIRATLNPRCAGVPPITIEQLCLLVIELAPMIVVQAQIAA